MKAEVCWGISFQGDLQCNNEGGVLWITKEAAQQDLKEDGEGDDSSFCYMEGSKVVMVIIVEE